MTQTQTIILRRFSKTLCVLTAFLIFAGSMVTSTGSGLSVPDWPLSYGMLFPPMVGGIFYEHGHRMIAAVVGFCTLILASLLWRWEERKWVKMLGLFAVGTVILQGVLGGVTVLFYLPLAISVSHAVLAQTFFVITIVIAYSQSLERFARKTSDDNYSPVFIKLVLVFALCVYLQLIFGALMRHTKSGLAIPDFPAMGGMAWPTFDTIMLNRINSWRFDMDLPFVTMNQVMIHFSHRIWALVIFLVDGVMTGYALKVYRHRQDIFRLAGMLLILLLVQITLGAFTVLSGKLPAIASLHVVTGAVLLGMSVLLLLRVFPLSITKILKPATVSAHV